jgi:hypothetical protein
MMCAGRLELVANVPKGVCHVGHVRALFTGTALTDEMRMRIPKARRRTKRLDWLSHDVNRIKQRRTFVSDGEGWDA